MRLLKAPFPWFGGKSRVTHLVWPRLGNVRNYVEPFAGSLAMLLGRPLEWPAGLEIVNDLDSYVANFWRAIQHDSEAVAAAADWPVNECDMRARHQWLHDQVEFRKRMLADPDYYDAKIAGWWVWGISSWIGSGWCSIPTNERFPRRRVGKSGKDKALSKQIPLLRKGGRGITRQIPEIIHGCVVSDHAADIYGYMERLADRLRHVRVCCGDWSRVLTPAATVGNGVTGVFLDPPYGGDRATVYAVDSFDVATGVQEWCRENGQDQRLRIALCGYAGDHEVLESEGWTVVAWKAVGGYGSHGEHHENAALERIWFSPGCQRKA